MASPLQIRRGLNIIPSSGGGITPPAGTGVVQVVGGVFVSPAIGILAVLLESGVRIQPQNGLTTPGVPVEILTVSTTANTTITIFATINAGFGDYSNATGFGVLATWKNVAGVLTALGMTTLGPSVGTVWTVTQGVSGTNAILTGDSSPNTAVWRTVAVIHESP